MLRRILLHRKKLAALSSRPTALPKARQKYEMTKTSNEKEVVQKILHGDTNAMKELYDMYIGRLNAICSRYITDKETVRDVLQDSFIKIFESISSFEYRGRDRKSVV